MKYHGVPRGRFESEEKVDAHSQLKALNEHIIGNPEFTNLPRKFNITLSDCPDDCVHAETQDLALVPAVDEKGGNMVYGFNVLVGGKLGSGGYHIADPLKCFPLAEHLPWARDLIWVNWSLWSRKKDAYVD